MNKYILLIALLLCFGALTTVSTQAQTNNNTIYACYQKNSGELRRVSGPGQCKNSEIPISWNVTGVQGPQGLQGDKGDKGDKGETGTPAPFPSNVIIVAKSGGHFTSIQAAINSITNASESNRYLVWAGPGTYNEQVTMKDFVDLQGAGETLTKISGTSAIILQGMPESSIRDLTVEGTDAAIRTEGTDLTNVTAIVNASVNFPRGIVAGGGVVMKNVTVKVNSTLSAGGLARGINNIDTAGLLIINSRVEINSPDTEVTGAALQSATVRDSVFTVVSANKRTVGINLSNQVTLDNVTITARSDTGNVFGIETAIGLPSFPEETVIRNSTIRAESTGQARGVHAAISKVQVQNSQIYAATSTLSTFGVNRTVMVSHSFLSGGPAAGTVKCAAVTDENYDFFPNTCP